MNQCPYHYDPGCERCRTTHPPELNQKIEHKAKESPTKVSSFKEFAIVMVLFIGFIGSGLYLFCVPGGLFKPNREVMLLGVSASRDTSGKVSMRTNFVWDGEEQFTYLSVEDIDVALRQDGQAHTSLILKNRRYVGSYFCNNATILVPNQEDMEAWNAKLKALLEERTENIVPRRIVP